MRGFVFFVFVAGYIMVLALYAVTTAQGRSSLRLPKPCADNAQTGCGPGQRARNVFV